MRGDRKEKKKGSSKNACKSEDIRRDRRFQRSATRGIRVRKGTSKRIKDRNGMRLDYAKSSLLYKGVGSFQLKGSVEKGGIPNKATMQKSKR